MPTPREELHQAIQDYVNKREPGVFVTGFAVIAAGCISDKPGWTSYHYVVPEEQPRHITQGLTRMLDDDVRFNSEECTHEDETE